MLGFAVYGLIVYWSAVREVNDPARVGVVIAFCNAPLFLAFGLLQWVGGLVLDAGWTGEIAAGLRRYPASAYRAVFAVHLALAAVATLGALCVTETRCRNVWAGTTGAAGPPTANSATSRAVSSAPSETRR